jgi:glutamate-1-semialdehyde aminotransferase
MVRAGRAEIARHSAVARLDDDGNRLVDCSCGWSGNALGWAGHLDAMVRSALDRKQPA